MNSTAPLQTVGTGTQPLFESTLTSDAAESSLIRVSSVEARSGQSNHPGASPSPNHPGASPNAEIAAETIARSYVPVSTTSRIHVFLVQGKIGADIRNEGMALALPEKQEAIVPLRALYGATSAVVFPDRSQGAFPVEEILAIDHVADLARVRIGGWKGTGDVEAPLADRFPGNRTLFGVWVADPVIPPPGSLLRGKLRLDPDLTAPPSRMVNLIGAAPDVGGLLLDDQGKIIGMLHPTQPWEEHRVGSSFSNLAPEFPPGEGLSVEDLTRNYYHGTGRQLLEQGLQSWISGDPQKAAADFVKLLRIEPELGLPYRDRIVESLLSVANTHRGRGDLSLAIARLDDYVNLLPNEVRLRVQLGRLLLEQGNDERAIDVLVQVGKIDDSYASELGPILIDAFLRWGEQKLRGGRHDDAYAILQRGLTVFPDNPSLLFLLGRILSANKNYEDALAVLERALSLDGGLESAIEPFLQEADRALGGGPVVEIHYPPNSRRIAVDILVADHSEELFILDTGATNTVITPAAAQRLGLEVDYGRRVRVSTAGGIVDAPIAMIPSLDLKGFRVHNIQAVVLSLLEGEVAGLVGLDFLNYFVYSVDAQEGVLTLRER